jgi:hypothetical protein
VSHEPMSHESMSHDPLTSDGQAGGHFSPTAGSVRNSYEHPPPLACMAHGDAPGLGVQYDEALAAKYPDQQAYQPVAPRLDGSLTDG